MLPPRCRGVHRRAHRRRGRRVRRRSTPGGRTQECRDLRARHGRLRRSGPPRAAVGRRRADRPGRRGRWAPHRKHAGTGVPARRTRARGGPAGVSGRRDRHRGGHAQGFGWPAPHRVVANAATQRWCHSDGTTRRLPELINARSAALVRLAELGNLNPDNIVRTQTPHLPVFSPAALLEQMPASWADRTALYAGESVLRMTSVISARDAVAELAGR
jgi:hypothetical protein